MDAALLDLDLYQFLRFFSRRRAPDVMGAVEDPATEAVFLLIAELIVVIGHLVGGDVSPEQAFPKGPGDHGRTGLTALQHTVAAAQVEFILLLTLAVALEAMRPEDRESVFFENQGLFRGNHNAATTYQHHEELSDLVHGQAMMSWTTLP